LRLGEYIAYMNEREPPYLLFLLRLSFQCAEELVLSISSLDARPRCTC